MKKILAFLIIILSFINSPLYGRNLNTVDSYSYDQIKNFYDNFEDMLILDFSFESSDSNINLDQNYVDFYTICSDIGKPNKKELSLSLAIYNQERKNFESSLVFFINEYYKYLEDYEIANLHLEFLSAIIFSSFKIKILGFCIQDMEEAKNFVLKELENNDIFNSIILNHKIKTNLNIFENNNINFKERVFLKSTEKVLSLLSIKDLFSLNPSNLSMINRILKNKKTNEEKFIIDWGDYYALMIGNDDYQDEKLVDLDSPLNDISLISDTLVTKYRFKKENIKVLKNATRVDILDTLFDYRELDQYNNNKNLLIYYAGHGEIDRIDENNIQGYWLPSDAHYQKKSSWISNNTIREELKALPFKHIIIIADSCFSGTWTAFKSSIKEIPKNIEARKKFLEEKNKLYARVALTSGNINEVPDTIDNNVNSQFAIALNNSLLRNDDILLSSKLHDDIIEEIQYSVYLQAPTYGGIINAKHSPGGNFIFVTED